MTERTWWKSSHSTAQGNCVEVCTSEPGTVAVRDSKNLPGPELAVSDLAWIAFVQGIKNREFDLA
jgi:Domain of unknown function (DUF397)